MAPEKNFAKSKEVTVRVGFFSIIFAAVITFVGLAWIFFLGVMVGRMYYGVDPNQNSQAPIVGQQSKQQSPQSQAWQENQSIKPSTAPSANKTGTTYHPVIKEDNMSERMHNAQNSPLHDDSIATDMNLKVDQNVEQNVEQSAVSNLDQSLAPNMEQSAVSNLDQSAVSSLDQNADQNFDPKMLTTLTEEEKNAEAGDGQNTVENAAQSTQMQENDNSKDTFHNTTIVENKEYTDTTVNQNTIDTNSTPTTRSEEIYHYTFQLATFLNPDNANFLTDALMADGLEATMLSEERDGKTWHYVLVYHHGTERSKEAVEKILAKHGYTTFILRTKKEE